MEIEKSIFFLCSIPYLDIILRPSMFLESSISTSNLPKSSKMYLRRYWRNRQPVLANLPTGIGQFANRYWPIRQPVLTKSSTGIGQFANRYWPNRQPVLANLPTGIDEITNQYWRNLMLVYLGRNNFFCPGNFFANSSQIYIIR